MEITEVRVKLVPPGKDKLRAFSSITIDDSFVIRDLKVIEGARGAFVAMPSRKLTERCVNCGAKNCYHANFCNHCGIRLPRRSLAPERAKLHADIAHPINSDCRELVQRRVLEAYEAELKRSADPGYRPAALDVFDEDSLLEGDAASVEAPAGPSAPDLEQVGARGPSPGRDVAGPRDLARAAVPAGGRERSPPAGERERAGRALPEIREVRPGRRPLRSDESRRPVPDGTRLDLPREEYGWRFGRSPAGPGKPRESAEEPEEPEDNFGAGLLS